MTLWTKIVILLMILSGIIGFYLLENIVLFMTNYLFFIGLYFYFLFRMVKYDSKV